MSAPETGSAFVYQKQNFKRKTCPIKIFLKPVGYASPMAEQMIRIKRPNNVADAIGLGSDGSWSGSYADHIFQSAYQPVYSNANSDQFGLYGYEGLARISRNGTFVSPDKFINSVGLDDRLFVECLCQALQIRNYRNCDQIGAKLFINLNPNAYRTFESVDLEINFVISALARHGLSTENFVVEILETEIISNEVLLKVVGLLRDHNVTIAMDDFGSKSSNYERYRLISPDIVKLDGDLFRMLSNHDQSAKLMASLVSSFKQDGVAMLVEGIETAEQLNIAQTAGFDLFQRYHFSKPEILPHRFSEVFVPVFPARKINKLNAA
jgi:EAL domain-containing protein (putative c-di-GMP-specific phosphodiesterase class I)